MIYPDTSARPLYYLFREPFAVIAAKRRTAVPKSFFIALNTSKNTHRAFLESMNNPTLQDTKKNDTTITKTAQKVSSINPTTKEELEIWLQNVEQTHRHRATEIIQALKHRGMQHPTIAIIDDFVGSGLTNLQLQKAFEQLATCYFYTMLAYNHNREDIIKDGIFVGKFVDSKYGAGFGYRQGFLKESIGVEKDLNRTDALYAQKIPDAQKDDLRVLRTKMSQLGKIIAKQIFFQKGSLSYNIK